MEYVLNTIGAITIAIGAYMGVEAANQLSRSGYSLAFPLLMSVLGSAIGVIVVGILFVAFGSTIYLLRGILAASRATNERLAAMALNGPR